MKTRGGATENSDVNFNTNAIVTEEKRSTRQNVWRNVLGVWGVVQVVSVLANALKRLYPIAMQPFIQKDMLPYQWVLYAVWCGYMGYAEGYKAFQLKFSPMVVQRAFSIYQNPGIFNVLLAGPYAMGMFGASRKRMIVSWCVTAGVFSLTLFVKKLPYPYRAIVDAGVVVGLTYGTLSIVLLAIKAFFGGKVEAPGDEEVVKEVSQEIKKDL